MIQDKSPEQLYKQAYSKYREKKYDDAKKLISCFIDDKNTIRKQDILLKNINILFLIIDINFEENNIENIKSNFLEIDDLINFSNENSSHKRYIQEVYWHYLSKLSNLEYIESNWDYVEKCNYKMLEISEIIENRKLQYKSYRCLSYIYGRICLDNRDLHIKYTLKVLEYEEEFEKEEDIRVDFLSAYQEIIETYTAIGRTKEAKYYLEKQDRLLKKYSPNIHHTIMNKINKGGLYFSTNNYSKAIETYESVLNIITKKRYPFISLKKYPKILDCLAYVYEEISDLEKAIYYHSKKRDIIIEASKGKKPKEHTKIDNNTLANCYSNIASILIKKGSYNEAILNLETAIELPELTKRTRSDIFDQMGFVYGDLGLDVPEELFYRESYKIRKEIKDEILLSSSIRRIASVLSKQGRTSESIKMIEEALEIDEKFYGKSSIGTTGSLDALGHEYSYIGQNRKALEYYEKALRIAEINYKTNHFRINIAKYNIGSCYTDLMQYEKANTYLNEALTNILKLKPYNITTVNCIIAVIRNDIFRYYNNTQDLEMKKAIFSELKSLYKKCIYLSSELVQNQTYFKSEYERLNFLYRMPSIDSIYEFSLDNKIFSYLALLHRINYHGLIEDVERRVNRLLISSESTKKYAYRIRDLTSKLSSRKIESKEKAALQKEILELNKTLYSKAPFLKNKLYQVEELSKIIPKNAILIEFKKYTYGLLSRSKFISPEYKDSTSDEMPTKSIYMALTISSKTDIDCINLGNAKKIEKKLKLALEATKYNKSGQQKLWDDLSNLIIKPLEDKISNKDILFFAPDGELNRFPFSILKKKNSDEYLSKSKKIRLLTSAKELFSIMKENTTKSKKSIVIANPDFDLDNNNPSQKEKDTFASEKKRAPDLNFKNFSTLEGSQKEGELISKLISAKFLSRKKATPKTISNLDNPLILHIATHGFYLNNNNLSNQSRIHPLYHPLLRSGVVLAGANNSERNTDHDDGYLTAAEFAKMELSGTEMVVISSCVSGEGVFEVGEGFYGLKRSLSVAGARSSLLSLWEVDDAATAEFMGSFYKYLIEGRSREEAFIETQKSFRDGTITSANPLLNWSEPYYWAAFQLSGDWRPIQGI
ncbi:CHAT domain-containing protein [Prochlorococcus sp. MIT 0916]|uniref:CHAT domain-containing protein n=1 Tax=Prochlorococcus sp. MIT 0916 TaxID=3082521 RepID=UPI0039B618AF